MANHLKFDIYELELTQLRSNKDLKRLLMTMANKSMLVVEDIDCCVDLVESRASSHAQYRSSEKEVTLSGILNLMDGLWSTCSEERIIVFTTNHKEKLDAALLRPGRMDVHVHMSYCIASAFRQFTANYLGIEDHNLFCEIEEQIELSRVTPAEVAEQLMRSDEAADIALQGMIDFLKRKKT